MSMSQCDEIVFGEASYYWPWDEDINDPKENESPPCPMWD